MPTSCPKSEAAFAKATERAPWDAADLDRIRPHAAPGRQVRRGARRLRNAIKANPSYAPAHRNLGVLLDLFLDDPLTAQTEFETYKTAHGRRQARQLAGSPSCGSRNKVPAPSRSEAAPRTRCPTNHSAEPAPKPEGGA